ncbi:MAG TPA: BMP family ABC transporter substrate-binding protein [Lachnoclostridium sp.]|uniref:BMP family ABC transporter substrate-binding protein n=1 Tax=Lacrimispora sp. TaxID=2719234 RepID=UPI000EDED46E|nr:BMP family ABC transporter substrate-binding protein [Lacrimispora sp.]HCD45206.1 BMP family ABC transporter substrate-binding protein [Lachnoclostridium sp.]
MKKTFQLILAGVLACAMLTACGKTNGSVQTTAGKQEQTEGSDTANGEKTPEKPIKAVYLVNGNLGDKGFYDSAASGLYRMRDELGADIKVVEMGRDETSYEGHFTDVSEQDWNVIIAGTWSVKEVAQNTAAQYPDKKYIFFDSDVDRAIVADGNMMGITYNSNQGSFLAGVLAAQMLDSGDAKIDASKRTLGFIGSMDVANINDFLVGYLEGVKYVDPNIKVIPSYVGSFEDVPKCLEMTTQLYNQGAQIVYAPASQSILGAATAASNVDKYLIACDQDLYTQLKDTNPDIAKNILTSTLKNVGDSLVTAVKGLLDNSMTCDKTYALGLDSGAVGLAQNDNFNTIVPEDIKKNLDTVKEKIIKGDITVGSAMKMTTEEVSALRDSMK